MSKKIKTHSIFRPISLIWAIPLLFALFFSVFMYLIPAFETVDRTKVEGSADWMGRLPGDISVSQVVFPGTHDSATQYVQLAFFSKCQALSIKEQLEAGFRYLDIRLGADGERLKLMHGFTSCTTGGWPWSGTLWLEDVLAECYSFLKAHPTETVLFSVKQEHGDETVSRFQELLDSYISKDRDMWLLTSAVPTVSEARGKLLLLRRFGDEAGLGVFSGLAHIWKNQKGYADPSQNTVSMDNGSYELWVQDRFEYEIEEKWAAFKEGMEKSDFGQDAIALNYLSAKGHAKFGHPYKYASALNPRLTEVPSASLRGWIIVDFASAGLAEHIYSANFN